MDVNQVSVAFSIITQICLHLSHVFMKPRGCVFQKVDEREPDEIHCAARSEPRTCYRGPVLALFRIGEMRFRGALGISRQQRSLSGSTASVDARQAHTPSEQIGPPSE